MPVGKKDITKLVPKIIVDKTGKRTKVYVKPFERPKKEIPIRILRGKLFEQLFGLVLKETLKNPNKYHNIEQFIQDFPDWKRGLEKLGSDALRKALLYNIQNSIKSLKSVLGDKINNIETVEFVGNKHIGTGKKADIVLKFKNNSDKEAYLNLSKIQVNSESDIGISIKTIEGGMWVGLQDSGYKTWLDTLEIPVSINPDEYKTPEDRLKIHYKIDKIDKKIVKEKLVSNLHKFLEDKVYKNMFLMISDFKTNRTKILHESELQNKFMSALQNSELQITYRGNNPKNGISGIYLINKNTNKKIVYIQPHLSRGNITSRISYDFMNSIIGES